jgi:ferredoxin--NADP+ reductase
LGQSIVVETQVIGNVAVLTGNRSLTGQDGEAFSSPGDGDMAGTSASLLAARLFDGDPAIDHVFAQMHVVVVRRNEGWDATSLKGATRTFETLFVYWGATATNDDLPIGGEGRGLDISVLHPQSAIDEGADTRIQYLRATNYNATITSIRRVHDSLWIIAVTPDGEFPKYQAGQYATLGLGFWEPRIDGRREELAEGQIERLGRRSYSISSSILDAEGSLLNPTTDGSLEFYIVLVETDWQETPAIFTPRLFLKDVGDQIYLGRKIAGRYRLDKLAGDHNDVVFLATGTGEAPHNRMILDLLRSEHRGQIVSVCTSRYSRDLAYLDIHNELMGRYDNYGYIPMTTREPANEGNKVYIQDLIKSGDLEAALGKRFDPENLHVFLCGNPAMIGPPKWDGDTPEYPEVEGVVELLAARGFTADRKGEVGNVHYEEYW